jgi:hypothetical protein
MCFRVPYSFSTASTPHTWACQCGHMNLFADRNCRACGAGRGDGWDTADRRKYQVEAERLSKGQPPSEVLDNLVRDWLEREVDSAASNVRNSAGV